MRHRHVVGTFVVDMVRGRMRQSALAEILLSYGAAVIVL